MMETYMVEILASVLGMIIIGFSGWVGIRIWKIETNHLTHIEKDIAVINTNIENMKSDIKEIKDALRK